MNIGTNLGLDVKARIFHISHNDLDGYGCQYLVHRTFYNAVFYNSDYHEIGQVLATVLRQIKLETMAKTPPALLLITDINLTMDMAAWLDKEMRKLPTALLLIDHHATGAACAERFAWYRLNTTKCATLNTYEWLADWQPDQPRAHLAFVANLVNVTDLWQMTHADFAKANMLADLMFAPDFLAPDMDEVHRNVRFHLIEHVARLFDEGATLEAAERALYDIRLSFLKTAFLDTAVVDNPNQGLESKYHDLILAHLTKHPPPEVRIKGHTCAVFFRWNGTLFQHVSSRYLQTGKVDICLRVGSNARISMRTQSDAINVGEICKQYFAGGGHPQAAGGHIKVKGNAIQHIGHALQAVKAAVS